MSDDQAFVVALVVASLVNVVVIRVALLPIQTRLDRIITELELWRYQREDDDAGRRQNALYEDLSG